MSDDELILVDLEQFESLKHALEQIQRHNGFDDCTRELLTDLVNRAESLTTSLAFVFSSVSRARALHEPIVREIGHANPQVVFTLMRQFAETIAVIRYAADHPKYFETVVRAPRIGNRACFGIGRSKLSSLIWTASTRPSLELFTNNYPT